MVADRRSAVPMIAHRIALRLLMFELPDQLTLCFVKSVGDVRILSDRD